MTYTQIEQYEILSRHAALTGLIRGAIKRGEDATSLKREQRELMLKIRVIRAEHAR